MMFSVLMENWNRNRCWSRLVLARTLRQQFVDDTHDHDAALPTGSKSGQLASCSEMTVTGSGHAMPNSGSCQRNPCSPTGA
jgi:hypothetical protein